MRGSTIYQVMTVWSVVDQTGTSRHDAKIAARVELSAKGQSATPHNISKQLGVYSYKTADAYRDVWVGIANHAKATHGVKDIERLTGEHVAGFLQAKVTTGIRYATFQQYAAAAEKLATALSRYAGQSTGRQYDFSGEIQNVRNIARVELERFTDSRAYADPATVRGAITDPDFRLAATLQHTSGARISEVALVKAEQLRGLKPDPITGQERGWWEAQGKGGKLTMHHTDVSTYKMLEGRIGELGHYRFDKDDYRAAIKQACAATGNKYQGSHGFRWNYAAERFDQCMATGRTYDQALAVVASEMGHDRTGITEHYRK